MTWLQTKSGQAFDFLDPRPESIMVEDIVFGLSNLCRYSGQLADFYSVAEHSIHVMHRVRALGGSVEDQRWGLMHDASEAYIVDMIAPLKRLLPEYQVIELGVMDAIAERFGLDGKMPSIVKGADVELLLSEKATMLGPEPRPWCVPGDALPNWRPRLWSPAEARTRFVQSMERLGLNDPS